ncbi:MAG: hypothetical protein H7Z73_00815 [Candidatus Saccharibacteria bacterium]|nr:hypothetical protein [Moraxellaceae bacterium]
MTTAKTTMTVSEIIARVGETDQLFLTAPTPMLAIERAQLRLMLVSLSHNQSEQLYFLGEAAVILELADTEAEDQTTHVLLAAQLAAVYLQFHLVTPQQRYLTVVGQILRAHSNSEHSQIFLGLARMDAAKGKKALTKHWLTRWLKVFNGEIDSSTLVVYPEFKGYLSEDWFQQFVVDAQNPQRLIPHPVTSVHS